MDKEISFYKNFKCLADKCPDTCCRGWEILVDDATAKELSGSRELRCHVKNRDGDVLIKRSFGKCHFETKEGLCELEKSGRVNLMPLVCREYPRRMLGFGEFTEMTMELACPEAARLFIEFAGARNIKLVEAEKSHPVIWTMGNDDKEYLDFLISSREDIMGLLDSEEHTLLQKQSQIMEYAKAVMEYLMRDNLEGAKKLSVFDFAQNATQYLYYPFEKLDSIVVNGLYADNLLWDNKKLFQLIRRYHKIFDKLTASQAQEVMSQAIEHLLIKYEHIMDKYTEYFRYILLEMYLTSYENYLVTRPIQQTIIYTELLMVMDCVEYITTGELSDESQVKVLSCLERRVRHSQSLTDYIFETLR